MFIEVENGNNVDKNFSMVYREVETPREVYCIKYSVAGEEKPVQVSGWDVASDRPCPAFACRVEESGDGVALLIYGGSGGIRLKELEDESEWSCQTPNQWGETHLVYPKDAFVVFQNEL